MRSIIILFAVTVCAPFLLASSCKKTTTCAKDVMCTQMFATITIQVTDQNGQPVVLDEVYTLRGKNSQKINFEQSNTQGGYIVLDDSYQKKLEQHTDNFRFVGMKNGQKVVDEPFVIGADCCHISKVSGKETIKL